MKRNMRYLLLSLLMLSTFSFLIYAEVPEHNPNLDYKCGPGSQWSRGTVSCKQANCPFPAGRTYTYECNCGDAWDSNSSLITCNENGLAVKCIPRGDSCSEYPITFDIRTGNCATNYEFDQDSRECITKGAPILKCSVKDLDGKAVSGAIIKYAVYNKTGTIASDSSVTRDDGSYSTVIPRKGSRYVAVSVEDVNTPESYRQSVTVQVRSDRVGECNIIVYNQEQVEKKIKADFEKFLRDACFPPELVARVKDAKIKFTKEGASSSFYISQDKTLYISEGDLRSGWGELQKGLAHEFGHWIVDNLIDESKYFVKGIPLKGKITGGPHNTWEPTKSDSWWVDPDKTAFDEATAEFLAAMYLKSNGKTYDRDFENSAKAREVLDQNPGKGPLIEGVIATLLYQYYKPGLDNNSTTPAKAFGDFYHSTKNGIGLIFKRPPRTSSEFIASRNAATGDWDCKVKNTGDLNRLAHDYGLSSSSEPKVEVSGGKSGDNLENVDLKTNKLKPGQEILIPKDSGLISIQWSTPQMQTQGKIPTVYFDKGENGFKVSENGQSIILTKGRSYVIDADVSTSDLKIKHQQTEYIVEVLNGKEVVTSLKGSVVVEAVDSGKNVAVDEGKFVEYTKENGFSELKKADVNNIINTWRSYTDSTTGTEPPKPNIPCYGTIGLMLAVLGGVMLVRKQITI